MIALASGRAERPSRRSLMSFSMHRRSHALAVLLALGGLLMAAPRALAIAPRVNDAGGFFDAATIERANAVIREIKDKYDKDLVIETYPAIPDNLKSAFA